MQEKERERDLITFKIRVDPRWRQTNGFVLQSKILASK